ncbi:MAG: hypothetical protein QXF12_02250 [Candidatus Aenigmatarchaeota archaeon]
MMKHSLTINHPPDSGFNVRRKLFLDYFLTYKIFKDYTLPLPTMLDIKNLTYDLRSLVMSFNIHNVFLRMCYDDLNFKSFMVYQSKRLNKMEADFFKNIKIDTEKNKSSSSMQRNVILTNNVLSFNKSGTFNIKEDFDKVKSYSLLDYMIKSVFFDRSLANIFSSVISQIFRMNSGIGEISEKLLDLTDKIVNQYFRDVHLKDFLNIIVKPYKEVTIDLKFDINLSLFFNVISALAVFSFNLNVFDRYYSSLYLAKQNNDFYDIKFNISVSIGNDENIMLCISNINTNEVYCKVIHDETLSNMFKSICKNKVFLSYAENKIDMYGFRLNQ